MMKTEEGAPSGASARVHVDYMRWPKSLNCKVPLTERHTHTEGARK